MIAKACERLVEVDFPIAVLSRRTAAVRLPDPPCDDEAPFATFRDALLTVDMPTQRVPGRRADSAPYGDAR
jgi:hypothetical protein